MRARESARMSAARSRSVKSRPVCDKQSHQREVPTCCLEGPSSSARSVPRTTEPIIHRDLWPRNPGIAAQDASERTPE